MWVKVGVRCWLSDLYLSFIVVIRETKDWTNSNLTERSVKRLLCVQTFISEQLSGFQLKHFYGFLSSSSTRSLWPRPSSPLLPPKIQQESPETQKETFFWPRASSSYTHQPWSSSSGGGFPSHTAGLLSACWVITHTGPLTCLKRVRNKIMN